VKASATTASDPRGADVSIDDARAVHRGRPGSPRAHAFEPASRPIDVLPTALGLLGLDADRSLLGRDLRPLMNGRAVPSDPFYQESLFGRLNCHWATLRGWVKDDWKLITGAAPGALQPRRRSGELRTWRADPDRVRA
jgi:arylsulfatase A-like enzyme